MKLLCSHREEKQTWHRGARESNLKVHPKEVEGRVIYFSVTLIACERFLVLRVSGQDGLTPSRRREKKLLSLHQT